MAGVEGWDCRCWRDFWFCFVKHYFHLVCILCRGLS
ncbi:hypothetical protein M6B38_348295 [Iris pallida]|uniref:Uncharacterized protein n=1 Tax=Iris pallida TaxID=29817 RepID=A0AAX6GS64_IRIPA|nr:hypothetical protein M6B38_348295 [Iris pallida]